VDAALKAAESTISKLADPQTHKPAVRYVYRARDIYHGPYVDQAPDLIPCWWGDGFLLDQSEPHGSVDRIVERSLTPVTDGVEFVATHQMDGFFVMAGGPARRGHAFAGAQLIDVAPTVLYLMGLPIPGDMDGKPLLEAIDPDFIARCPVRYEQDTSADNNGAPPASDESAFTAEEAEMIAKRLQAMGYIE
jgi:predicted AlkP superfamily phosphohydrolase/phosphomutase